MMLLSGVEEEVRSLCERMKGVVVAVGLYLCWTSLLSGVEEEEVLRPYNREKWQLEPYLYPTMLSSGMPCGHRE
jgi:hypothetical protein